jgi:predicted branched-subunit amino acid permease
MLGYRADGSVDRRRYLVTGITVTTGWVLGTAAGAWGGSLIGDPTTYGIDAAYPALFLALLAPELRRDPLARWAGSIGIVVVLASYPFLPQGLPIVAAAIGALVGLVGPRDAIPERST